VLAKVKRIPEPAVIVLAGFIGLILKAGGG